MSTGSRLRLVFCKCQQARNWDLAVYWFRGRNDINDWDATKLKVVMEFGKRSRFHGKKWGNHCQRFNVNVTVKCICGLTILWMRIGKWFWRSRFHREKRGNHCHRFNVNVTAKCICGLIILWMKIGKWFWRGNQMGTGPLGFLANP